MALTAEQLKKLRRCPVGPSGNRLKAAIQLSGRTAVSIGADLGFTPSHLGDICRGRWNITVPTAHKFAHYFGCCIEDLFPPSRKAVA